MNCESSVGPVRREMHVLYVPLTPKVTTGSSRSGRGLVVVEWFRAVSSGGVLNEEGRELVVEEIQSVMNRGVTKGL